MIPVKRRLSKTLLIITLACGTNIYAGKGAGPIAGSIGYWGTKLLGYGVITSGLREIVRFSLTENEGIAPKKGSKKRVVFDEGIRLADTVLLGDLAGANTPVVGAVSNTITKFGGEKVSAVATLAGFTVYGQIPVEGAATTVGVALAAIPFLP